MRDDVQTSIMYKMITCGASFAVEQGIMPKLNIAYERCKRYNEKMLTR